MSISIEIVKEMWYNSFSYDYNPKTKEVFI